MNKICLIFLQICCCFAWPAKGQHADAILNSLVKRYDPGKDQLITRLTFFYYKDARQKFLIDSMNVMYSETAHVIHSVAGKEEYVSFDSVSVFLDHTEKTISIIEMPFSDSRPFSPSLIRTLMEKKYKMSLRKDAGRCYISINTGDDYTDSISIVTRLPEQSLLSTTLYFSKRYVLDDEMPPNSCLVIQYRSEKRLPFQSIPEKLRKSTYYLKSEDELVPNGKYKSYQFIN